MHKEPDLSAFSTTLAIESAGALDVSLPRLAWPNECPSTNDALGAALQEDADAWPDFSVFGTDFQSAGHARLDRTWVVPPRSCLTFSVPLRLPDTLAPDAAGWIPLTVGWAVARAVRGAGAVTDVDGPAVPGSVPTPCPGVTAPAPSASVAAVKWPNDVLIAGKKVCGILCRMEVVGTQRIAVIGIGLNVHLRQDQLPVPTATSTDLAGAHATREELLAAIMAGLREGLIPLVEPGRAPVDRIAATMITLGKAVRVELGAGRAITGTAEGLGPGAELLVRDDGGELHTVAAGDVVHLRGARTGSLA